MTVITHPDRDLIALGIRQPWAELILRGIKSIEVRSLPTNVRGTIYLYAGQHFADIPHADIMVAQHGLDADRLPRSLILGTVDIVDCRPCATADATAACVPASMLEGKYGWRLTNPVRLDEPFKPRFLPYGVWFYPFKRRNGSMR
ncbi:MAG: ASCH domain-containing protein [Planctomycetaceae bacterium]|nr:ASCH domain-containing protein [Planctomycetaceae bacterium]